MSRIDHDVSSVTSSLQSDIHSQEEPVQYQPSAVNEPSLRRPSMIRRLSIQHQVFNASNITQESLVEDVETIYWILGMKIMLKKCLELNN